MKLMAMMERIATTLRLPPSPTHQPMIPINENPRKRRSSSPNQAEEEDDQESGNSLPQNPNKTLRLFGFDIPIPEDKNPQNPNPNPQEENPIIPQNPNPNDQEQENPIIPQNPNPNHQEQENLIIPQNPNPNDQEQENPIIPQNPNPNDQEEEEALIPQNPNQEPAPIDIHPVYNLLFEKELTSSDVARAHNRLLITGSQRLMTALTEEERGRVEMNQPDGYLRVLARDINGGEYILRLKKWAGSGAIVLKHEWGKFVRANALERGDSVRGWGYRVRGELKLVIDFVRDR